MHFSAVYRLRPYLMVFRSSRSSKVKFDEIWRQKTRVLGLPEGEEIMPLAFFVLIQYRRVTDRRTDGQKNGGQTRCDHYYTIIRASISSRG